MLKNTGLLLFTLLLLSSCVEKSKSFVFNEGTIFGTLYHIKYESEDGKDLHADLKEAMDQVNQSLSSYNPQSVISKVNRNEEVELDPLFTECIERSLVVSEITDGAFDITISPVANAWGFGFKNKANITPELIDSLLQYVGYQKIQLKDGQLIKENKNIMLDVNAIAKGKAVDLVADKLRELGSKNFMVEIGGEIVTRGFNDKNELWRIGINKPVETMEFINQDLKAIITLDNIGMATSGNYRNFYVENGKKYAHTIDPKSGYPIQHSILSSTVLASDCMTADAYATAFMVMGVEKAKALLESNDEIEGFLIYSDEEGKHQTWASEGFKKNIVEVL